MTIFGVAASLLIKILHAFGSRLLTDELKAWTPWVIERIIRSAVSMLPESERERFEEEWRSHIHEFPGPLGKLYQALGLLFAARKMTSSLTPRKVWAYRALVVRTLDIGGTGLMIILIFPLLLILALALRLTGSGDVLRRDLRVGLNGQTFFRHTFCMPSGALGNFLRLTSLNELPQLFNVLRGDMTIIGPPPQIFRIVPHVETVPQPEKISVKPGFIHIIDIIDRGRKRR
jgi:hypothetical protein